MITNLTLDNVDIINNYAWGSDALGGGLYIAYSSVNVSNSTFANNYAGRTAANGGGGAVYMTSSTATFNRCLFYDNEVEGGLGESIYVIRTWNSWPNSILTIDHSTFVDNDATASSGIYLNASANYSSPTVTMKNSILSNTTYTYTSCSYQNCYQYLSYNNTDSQTALSTSYGAGNIRANPNFAYPEEHDYSLEWPSLSINTANPNNDGDNHTYETDLDDQDPDGTQMDMGVFPFNFNGCDDDGETPCTFECGDPLASNYDENADYFKDSFNCVYDNYGPILYVSKETGEDPVSSEDLWDGSETYPFKTIQFALDVADDDELIYVKPGVYEPGQVIYWPNKFGITLRGEDKENTFIDGNYNHQIIDIGSNTIGAYEEGEFYEDENNNGLKDSDEDYDDLHIIQDHVTIENLTFREGFEDTNHGGAIYFYYVDANINNVHMMDNHVPNPYAGGAIILNNSTVNIENSIFSNNTAGRTTGNSVGGAIYSYMSTLNLTKCLFKRMSLMKFLKLLVLV